jgi:F-type H+-transporting ATPase subunit delta
MTGAVSRASLAEARERLAAVIPAAGLGEELLEVLHLLDREHGLRRALSDPSRAGEDRAQLVQILLEGKISATALGLVQDVVRLRWSRPSELADAIEELAVSAEAAAVEADGRLDDLEDELFRFSRVVAGEPALRGALTNVALPAERKAGLLGALLGGKAQPATVRLVTEAATRPRGRSLERALDAYGRVVAERRRRLVALVRTAVELTAEQRTRLAESLSAAYGHDVHLNIEVDPTVVGGLSIQIGDEEIDGTIAGRLEEVRRRLT